MKRKADDLAPYIEAAFKRKAWMAPLTDDEIKPVVALGRQIAEEAARNGAALPPNPQMAAWDKAVRKAQGG